MLWWGFVEPTLLLNGTYEPLLVINWKKAIILLWQDKVEVLAAYEKEIRGVSRSIRLPSVLRLHKAVRIERGRRGVKFSRANIFMRDDHRCQYCNRQLAAKDLTIDHVVPLARNGRKTWENIVTACWPCNNTKSGRTPEEARMRLGRQPIRPAWQPFLAWMKHPQTAPPRWRDYLFQQETSLKA